MGTWYETPGRGRKKCPKCGRYVPAKLRGKPCPAPGCTYVWTGRKSPVELATPMRAGESKVWEAGRALLERVGWDLESARALLRDTVKIQTREKRKEDAIALRELKEQRYENELKRRKHRKRVLEARRKIKEVDREWRRREDKGAAADAKWKSEVSPSSPVNDVSPCAVTVGSEKSSLQIGHWAVGQG